jgi:hypothetical protein
VPTEFVCVSLLALLVVLQLANISSKRGITLTMRVVDSLDVWAHRHLSTSLLLLRA